VGGTVSSVAPAANAVAMVGSVPTYVTQLPPAAL